LCVPKGGAHIARACEGFVAGQDGGCSRAEDHAPLFGREFVLGSEPDEEILILRITCQKLDKPAALGGDVVDDAVEHELVASFQRFDIAPQSEQRVNLSKSIIEKPRSDEEGKKGRMWRVLMVPLR
jgi:hypothetical protein